MQSLRPPLVRRRSGAADHRRPFTQQALGKSMLDITPPCADRCPLLCCYRRHALRTGTTLQSGAKKGQGGNMTWNLNYSPTTLSVTVRATAPNIAESNPASNPVGTGDRSVATATPDPTAPPTPADTPTAILCGLFISCISFMVGSSSAVRKVLPRPCVLQSLPFCWAAHLLIMPNPSSLVGRLVRQRTDF